MVSSTFISLGKRKLQIRQLLTHEDSHEKFRKKRQGSNREEGAMEPLWRL